MKKKLITLAVAATAVALVAGTTQGANAASSKPLRLIFISKGFDHQFWQAVKKGAQEQGKKMNATVQFIGPANESLIDHQLQMLDDAIASRPDGIGYAALGTTESLGHLAAAKKAGIPVYGFDTAPSCPTKLGVKSACELGIAYTNSKAAGALAADKMGALLGGKGKVFVLAHSQTNQTGIDRRDGFVNEIAAKFPGITVLPVQYANDSNAATTVATTALTANPDLAGMYTTNEGGAVGADAAFKSAGITNGKIKLIGFDSGQGQIDAINSGLQAGAITQNPIGIGAKTVEALVNFIRNKKVPATTIDTGFYYYDKSNITDPKITADLYN